MATKYTLLNPTILGDFKSQITAKNSTQAARIFYKNLSEHFNNVVPQFHFTIQKGGSGTGKYYHYAVKEHKDDNNVNFKIKLMENIPSTHEAMVPFKQKLEKFQKKMEQGGGDKKKKRSKHKSKKYDDSSDSDSDSDDFYKRVRTYKPVNQPIYYWWYDPYVYNLDTLYVPTFYSYVTPYIELGLYPYYYP
jgi:hypothetical protein